MPLKKKGILFTEYGADFTFPFHFGTPGAVLITNLHDKEFHLVKIFIHGFGGGPIFFPADSLIHSHKDNPDSRIIFKNQIRIGYIVVVLCYSYLLKFSVTVLLKPYAHIAHCCEYAYLPSQTPPGLKDLRREDLLSTRGNGKGERKSYERIYDYAPYNDLGNPEKDDRARPVLAGYERPYPRRCRTGRPPTKSDPSIESRIEKPHPVYVPRDETFEEIKQGTFSAGRLKAALHNLIPMMASKLSSSYIPFKCFSDFDKLYNDGILLKEEEQSGTVKKVFLAQLMKEVFTVGDKLLKFEIPAIIRRISDSQQTRPCSLWSSRVSNNKRTDRPRTQRNDC